MRRTLAFLLLAAVVAFAVQAQTAGNGQQSAVSITTILNSTDNVTVTHPDALERRLVPTSETVYETADSTHVAARKMGGYRVQVFSDNNPQTAENEANRKASSIAALYPQYATYVVYVSPYWRLKVGDFRTREEAEVAATEIKRSFPAFAREIRVIRDRINK